MKDNHSDWLPEDYERESDRLFAEGAFLRKVLGHAREKLELYRDHSNGQYHGGIEHTALIRMIYESLNVVSDKQKKT